MKFIAAAVIAFGFVSAGTIELPSVGLPTLPLPAASTKDCVICPQVVPECGPCPDGQECLILPQTCKSCPLAICHPKVSDAILEKLGEIADTVTITKWPESLPTGCIPPGSPLETLINEENINQVKDFVTGFIPTSLPEIPNI